LGLQGPFVVGCCSLFHFSQHSWIAVRSVDLGSEIRTWVMGLW
jgi:hypothetical protein